MPNIKSAIKRVKVIKSKTLSNNMLKSALKTVIRKAKETVQSKDTSSAEAVKNAIKAIDKSVSKGILTKNTAARKKSKLAKSLQALSNEK